MKEAGCVWVAHDPATRVIPVAWKIHMDRKKYAYRKVYLNTRTDDGATSSDASELGLTLDNVSDHGAGRAIPQGARPLIGGSSAARPSNQGGVNLATPRNPVVGSGTPAKQRLQDNIDFCGTDVSVLRPLGLLSRRLGRFHPFACSLPDVYGAGFLARLDHSEVRRDLRRDLLF
ncbi:hypothetical protein F4780DRAFT_321452 [Xylariomycetidae sp. FL0641]|nr:hypothetical protein F4780DRAFT_321452 [Xylariomycetidae sp. FL0641]